MGVPQEGVGGQMVAEEGGKAQGLVADAMEEAHGAPEEGGWSAGEQGQPPLGGGREEGKRGQGSNIENEPTEEVVKETKDVREAVKRLTDHEYFVKNEKLEHQCIMLNYKQSLCTNVDHAPSEEGQGNRDSTLSVNQKICMDHHDFETEKVEGTNDRFQSEMLSVE